MDEVTVMSLPLATFENAVSCGGLHVVPMRVRRPRTPVQRPSPSHASLTQSITPKTLPTDHFVNTTTATARWVRRTQLNAPVVHPSDCKTDRWGRFYDLWCHCNDMDNTIQIIKRIQHLTAWLVRSVTRIITQELLIILYWEIVLKYTWNEF